VLLDEPHHDGSVGYVPQPAPALGEAVPVRVFVPHRADGSPGAREVVLRVVRDGEPALSQASAERVDDAGTWWQADLLAWNRVNSYRFLVSGAGGGYGWLNGTGLHHRDVSDAADFRLVTYDPPPDWVADQVVYQVFPDRFARSAAARANGNGAAPGLPSWARRADWDDPVVHRGPDVGSQVFGGDLDGVAQHLSHLSSLGATMVYLTPFFEARSNHRYDAVSFDHVDPLLGGDAALDRLVRSVHRLGMRVIGDLTTNHTGAEHVWFRAAQADPSSIEAGFYRFRRHPDDYEGWLDVRSLPKLDHASAALAARLYAGPTSVVARWLAVGLDGWRIDVANMTGRAGALDHAGQVARALRRTATDVNQDSWVVAEHGHDAAPDLDGDGWHGTMDYSGFTRPVWAWLNGGGPGGPGVEHGLTFLGLPVGIPVLPGTAVVATMREVHARMPWRSWAASTTHLDTHDTPRFRTVTGGGTTGWVDAAGTGRDRHLVGLALQLTMPGVPTVFMGDELGLTGLDGEHARTPFPWGRPREWDTATFDAYVTWVGLRREQVALRRGGLRWVDVGADSMTYLREHPEQRVLVHVARDDHAGVRIPLRALGIRDLGQLDTLVGQAPTDGGDGTVALPRGGPAAHAYLLA
jgi:alpha-glucosidase